MSTKKRKRWNEYSDDYLGKVFRWCIVTNNYVDVSDEYYDIEEYMIDAYENRNKNT